MARRKRRPQSVLPRSVTIGGHVIRIETDDGLGERAGCYGQYHDSRNLIVVDSRFADSLQSETLLHEIVEAINAKAELRLRHYQIQALALLLHQALTTAQ